MNKWTKKFPDRSGHYWFYGYRFGKYFGDPEKGGTLNKPELCHVKVRECMNGFMVVADGHFMYESEIEQGHFMPIELPEFPELD